MMNELFRNSGVDSCSALQSPHEKASGLGYRMPELLLQYYFEAFVVVCENLAFMDSLSANEDLN